VVRSMPVGGGVSSSAAHARKVLRLYRGCIRAARAYPTRNREGLVVQIRDEFRAGAAAVDAGEVEQRVAQAEVDLARMQAMRGMTSPSSGREWVLHLG